ncbi:hypothetical protein KBD45_07030 [Candidatus Dojkabacteria bacterium]|nr:hypothetical protein [Candidatus Dojkabacteria bacterium]
MIKKNPLFYSFVILILVDVIGTVFGQPKEYWTSGYKVFHEALPIFPLLQIHPLLFILVCLSIWLPFTYWLVLRIKKPINLWAAMALIIGHGYNSVFWFRVSLFQAGVFTGRDQLSMALSLVPMTVYVLFVSWVAFKSIQVYFIE